jgi:hypothetical protein
MERGRDVLARRKKHGRLGPEGRASAGTTPSLREAVVFTLTRTACVGCRCGGREVSRVVTALSEGVVRRGLSNRTESSGHLKRRVGKQKASWGGGGREGEKGVENRGPSLGRKEFCARAVGAR